MKQVDRIKQRLEIINMPHNAYIDIRELLALSDLQIPPELEGLISDNAHAKIIWRWYKEDIQFLLDLLEFKEDKAA